MSVPTPLTNIKVKNIKPSDKSQRLFDGRGLYLEISPRGGKWWRFKYRFESKGCLISLGVYPDISLKDARERREAMRKLIVNGINPSRHRKEQKAAKMEKAENSFEVICREWITKKSKEWSDINTKKVTRLFERDIFPVLEKRPLEEITPQELLRAIRPIEKRGAIETAHRALGSCNQLFRYAIATGRAKDNPAGHLRGALTTNKGGHLASITEPEDVAKLLRMLDTYEGSFIIKSAIKLAPLVFVRPGELRHAQWKDINLEGKEWRYLVTKTKTQHIVPLCRQSIEIFEELKPFTGTGQYVFPSPRSPRRPISDNAILAAMRRVGIPKEEMCTHGFRAMARTILDEVLKFRPDFIEHQLAHAVRDPNGRAYNRTAHLGERRKMMQTWADYLDEIKRTTI